MLAASSTNILPFFSPFGFAIPAGIMPLRRGISSSFSEYTRFFFLFDEFLDDSDFDFCAPPGLAKDMDFCLRFEMPSGAEPVGFGFDDFEDFAELDLPFELLPLTEGLEGAILRGSSGGRFVLGCGQSRKLWLELFWGSCDGWIGVFAWAGADVKLPSKPAAWRIALRQPTARDQHPTSPFTRLTQLHLPHRPFDHPARRENKHLQPWIRIIAYSASPGQHG